MVTKLKITPCDINEDGSIGSPRTGEAVELMLNPSSYTHDYQISYSTKTAKGTASPEPKFDNFGPQKVKFDVVIDGTGVVPVPKSEKSLDVKDRVNKLNKAIYKYVGKEHQPNVVQLLWGSLLFNGRLESMSVDYTLFTPSGLPLRAKVKLSFTGYASPTEEALRSNRSSPDLTHIVDVKAGDSLPLLCFRIYKDSAYYMEVAKRNGITNFRNIKPGTRLLFPPLR